MNRVLVDLSDHRLRLDQEVLLSWDEGQVVVTAAVLDTGSAAALIGPASLLRAPLPRDATVTRIDGFGGVLQAWAFPATLSFLGTPHDFPVRATIADDASVDRWYIGLPILRHFDLLLRSRGDRPHGPHLSW